MVAERAKAFAKKKEEDKKREEENMLKVGKSSSRSFTINTVPAQGSRNDVD